MTAAPTGEPETTRAVSRYEWENVLRRITSEDLLPDRLLFAALMLATYADPDGTRVRPGEPELAAALRKGQATVRRYVGELRALGFVRLVSRGGGRGLAKRASVYRLTLPIDLLDQFDVRPPGVAGRVSSARSGARTQLTVVSGVSTETQLTTMSGVSVDNPVDQPKHRSPKASGDTPVDNPAEPGNSAQITPFPKETPLISAKTPLTLGERPPATSPTTRTTTTTPDPTQPQTAREPRDPDHCPVCHHPHRFLEPCRPRKPTGGEPP